MKVTIYALHLGFGGVERYVATLANILSKEHEVQIISTYRTTPEPAFPIDKKVSIVYLLEKLLPNNEAFHNAIRRKNPFAICKEGCYAAYVLFQRRHQNIKAIKHDKSDVIISTRIFHNALISKYADRRSIKITGEHNHPHGNTKYMKNVISSCKGFDYFIPISKALCELYEAAFTYPIQIKYIPFCIEKNDGQRRELPKERNLINVGRFSPEKGISDLLLIMKELIHTYQFPVTLQLIGSGEEEAMIRSLISQYRIEEYVILHGFQVKDYVYEQYKKASLYVMTSFTESFGIVLLEAMSCGVPCLAFDSAEGSREIIENGVDGYLIQNRKIESMCEMIIKLLSDPELLENMSLQAVKKADMYSYEQCEQAWLTFFKQL